ncbi:uncharacterized protein [Dermacentor albipictus]|uniref:uncharacterized protein n=1 Tax=Dermacentor albipictus TaxID=60249 RepID=UPI0031FCFB36
MADVSWGYHRSLRAIRGALPDETAFQLQVAKPADGLPVQQVICFYPVTPAAGENSIGYWNQEEDYFLSGIWSWAMLILIPGIVAFAAMFTFLVIIDNTLAETTVLVTKQPAVLSSMEVPEMPSRHMMPSTTLAVNDTAASMRRS